MRSNKELGTDESGVLSLSALEDPSYKAVFASLQDELIDGEEIPGDVAVSLMRSTVRGITASSFSLRPQDRYPIGSVESPGKSAHIKFTDSAPEYSRIVLGQPPRTGQVLVDICAFELREVGFRALYAPVPTHPLHVRLVHNSHLRNPTSPADIPEDARSSLARIVNYDLQRARE